MKVKVQTTNQQIYVTPGEPEAQEETLFTVTEFFFFFLTCNKLKSKCFRIVNIQKETLLYLLTKALTFT